MPRLSVPADPVLERLAGLDLDSPADPGRVESALRSFYHSLQQPFPGFRPAANLKSEALDRMRAGMAGTGAADGGLLHGPWFRLLHPLYQRCGNEPEEFKSKISRLRHKARGVA